MYAKVLPALLVSVVSLGASGVGEIRIALNALRPKGEILATARFTERETHPSDSKSSPIERRCQVRLRSTGGGELWVQCPEAPDETWPWATDPKGMHQLLDQAKAILAWLDCGRPITPDPRQTEVASPLVFHLLPEPPARLRRRLKGPEGTLRLWVDRDGMPQKATLEQSYGGRAQRIAPDETLRTRLKITFQTVGGRVVARRLEEDREECVGYDIKKIHREIELDPFICTD